MVEGYNISLKVNTKTLLGRTQDDLTIAAVVKESITKDNAGVVQKKVVRHDVSFRVSALLSLNDTGVTTQLDRDDIIELALVEGDSAPVAVQYLCTGGSVYGGYAIITGYSESSSAAVDSDTTISLDLQIVGDFEKATI